MPDVVLATLNARFIHASFGLRYLRANLGELRPRSEILEFTIQERPLDVAEQILAREPRIVGLGVYIWNVAPTTELVALLKRLRPDLVVVLGGPEVSHETDKQEVVRLADHTIAGEADLAFAALCRDLLAGRPPPAKVIAAPLPALGALALPYDEYADADIAHRLVYVEASRGCPFECEFCLSSLDVPVRQFPLEAFLAALDRLFARGVRHFKFVDRTFNLNLAVSRAILEFFLARLRPGLFLHFEMIPDRLPAGPARAHRKVSGRDAAVRGRYPDFPCRGRGADQPAAGLRAAGGQPPLPARGDGGARARRSHRRPAGGRPGGFCRRL
jgi:radical SAM superfamily enzyme YgiQ (UPF0313 family)